MRSAVNIQRLQQARVPDNRHVISAAKSIGNSIAMGLARRKAGREEKANELEADTLRGELLGSRNNGNGMEPEPQLTPEQRQGQLQEDQVNLAEEQIVNETIQKAEAKRQEIQKQNTWRDLTNNPELAENMLRLQKLDPQMAKGVANILVSRDANQIQGLQDQALQANRFESGLAQLALDPKVSDSDIKGAIRNRAAQLQEIGTPIDKLAPLMSMDRDQIVSSMRTRMAMSQGAYNAAEGAKPIVLSKDQIAFDAQGNELASNRGITDADQANIDIKKGELDLKQIKQSQELAKLKNPPPPDFKEVQSLRKEFTAETKGFADVNDAYTRVLESAKDPSPAGDMALVFNYMKILDPGSTVREGEAASVQQAGSLPKTLVAKYNKLVSGELLEDSQRKDFVDRAGRLFKGAANNNRKRESEYTRLANLRGINPEEVIVNRDLSDQQSIGALDQARAAISAGANREAVIERLRANGIDVGGL